MTVPVFATSTGSLLVPTLSVLAGVTGAVVLLWGLWELRLAYRIYADEPVSVMETTAGGSVEVTGTVTPADGVLEAPFTETSCVAYEYAVEEKRTRSSSAGKRTTTRTEWTEVDSGSRVAPFRLEDDTGRVLVDPAGADLRLSAEGAIRVRGGEIPPEPIASFVRENEAVSDENRSIGIGPLEFATGRDRRYRERRLDVGEIGHVLGTARFDTAASQEAGDVTAVIGAAEPSGEERSAWVRHRLFGPPFLIADSSPGRTALRVAGPGLLAVLLGAALVGVVVLVRSS